MTKFDFATVENEQTQSSHPNQDRSCFVSSAPINQDEVERFYRESFEQMKENSQSYQDRGSTFSSLSYNSQSKVATICNLGDSRAYAILASRKTGLKLLVSLSEDMKLTTARFKAKIKEKGGEITEPKNETEIARINGLAMAGSFGDKANQHIIRDPEIFSFDLANLEETILSKMDNRNDFQEADDFEITKFFVASDGFCDVETGFLKSKNRDHPKALHFDFVYHLEFDENLQTHSFKNIPCTDLFLKEHVTSQTLADQKLQEGSEYSAESLTQLARQYQSDDDITICALDLEKRKTGFFRRQEKPQQFMITVADGHGRALETEVENSKEEKEAKYPSEFLTNQIKEKFEERFLRENPRSSTRNAQADQQQKGRCAMM